ncbi:uncharacterized protein [Musca autumnalis]
MYRTGGGPPQSLNLSCDEELLLSLIGPSTFGLKDRGGGDNESNSDESAAASSQSFKDEMNSTIEFLDTDIEIVFGTKEEGLANFRPNEAVNILKRPLPKVLSTDKIEINGINNTKQIPTLEGYEKTKYRKRNAEKLKTDTKRSDEKLDDLIQEYEDLKKEKKLLLAEQTNYYIEKNQRENKLFEIEMEIKQIEERMMEQKLNILKQKGSFC